MGSIWAAKQAKYMFKIMNLFERVRMCSNVFDYVRIFSNIFEFEFWVNIRTYSNSYSRSNIEFFRIFLSRIRIMSELNVKLCLAGYLKTNFLHHQNLTSTYSQSACEYECAIQNAVQKCQCSPWNIPRISMSNPPFCDYLGNFCFNYAMETISFSECNCPSDCFGTYFSVFESSKPFENPGI